MVNFTSKPPVTAEHPEWHWKLCNTTFTITLCELDECVSKHISFDTKEVLEKYSSQFEHGVSYFTLNACKSSDYEEIDMVVYYWSLLPESLIALKNREREEKERLKSEFSKFTPKEIELLRRIYYTDLVKECVDNVKSTFKPLTPDNGAD